MKPLRRPSRLERWVQKRRAKLAEYDLEALVNVSLGGIVFVWFVYVMVFKPVMP